MALRIDPDFPKYALVKMDRVRELHAAGEAGPIFKALEVLRDAGVLNTGHEAGSEFFVLMLKDAYADDALFRYALSAKMDGEGDYSRQIEEMAMRSGPQHPDCKKPD